MSHTTKLITDRSQMLRELQALQPRRIAVAYVGRDWRELLGKDRKLEEVILAPVVGTNPTAVREIARALKSWDRVHFLDQLHAKVYLGNGAALIGSANLSGNALLHGGMQLFEMLVRTTDTNVLELAEREFENYRALAMSAYRSKADKIARIEQLEAEQTRIENTHKRLAGKGAPTLDRYKVGSLPVHLEWWESEHEDGCDPDDTNYINTKIGSLASEFGVGNWVLQWRCDAKGMPTGRRTLEWMRIDAIRLGQASGEDTYTDQLAERVEPPKNTVPFQLDDRVQKAFRELMRKSDLRPDGTEDVSYEAIPRAAVDVFLLELQRRYRADARAAR